MITKRTLIKWRKEALISKDCSAGDFYFTPKGYNELIDRVLRLTQELIDQKLLKGE
jgi:hypothetical protein